jgi:hypothetical protein
MFLRNVGTHATLNCHNTEDHDSYSCAYLINCIRMNLGLNKSCEIHRKAVFFVLTLVRTGDHSGILAVKKYVQCLVVFPKGQGSPSSVQCRRKSLWADSIPTACDCNKERQQYGQVINWTWRHSFYEQCEEECVVADKVRRHSPCLPVHWNRGMKGFDVKWNHKWQLLVCSKKL